MYRVPSIGRPSNTRPRINSPFGDISGKKIISCTAADTARPATGTHVSLQILGTSCTGISSYGRNEKPRMFGACTCLLYNLYVCRLQAFGTLFYFKRNLLIFSQRLETFRLNLREMDENIIAVFSTDKPVTFPFIKPLNSSYWHETYFLRKKKDSPLQHRTIKPTLFPFYCQA
jgi:hypothetical protein